MPSPPAERRPRRRIQGADRCMDEIKDKTEAETVLLNSEMLTEAFHDATKGGKKKIEGLYLPGGKKVEANASEAKVSTVANAEAQQDLHLQRVSKVHAAAKEKRYRKAERAGKTEEELNDEESTKKATAILAATNEHDQIMYRELFNFFDVDKDKTWGSIEFAQRMTDIGYATNVEDASNLLYFAGVRDVDRITYHDFIQLMPKLKAYRAMIEKDAMRHFQNRDPGTGWLTPKLCKLALQDIMGPAGLDMKQVNFIAKKADRLKDGRITYEFFIRALFDGTTPVTRYEPPRRRHPMVRALLGVLGCGASQQRPQHQVGEQADDPYQMAQL